MKPLLRMLVMSAALGGVSSASANHEQSFFDVGSFSFRVGQSRHASHYGERDYGHHGYDSHYHQGHQHHSGYESRYRDEPHWSGRYAYGAQHSVFPWFDSYAQGTEGYAGTQHSYAAKQHAKKKARQQRKVKRKKKRRKATKRKAKKRSR